MEPIDYNNKLADVRKDYRNSLKNMRNEQKEHINQLEKAHQYQRSKQRDSYDERIKEFETENRDANVQFTKKTKEVIDQKNTELKNHLAQERREFERDNQDMRQKLSKKLDVLKDSFGRSKREMKKHYDRSINHNDRLTKDKIANAHEGANKTVKYLADNHAEAFDRLNDRAKAEKNHIITKHNAHIGQQINEDSDARKRMNKRHQQEVKALRNNYRDKLAHSRQHYMDQVGRLKMKNKNEKANQTQAYEDLARISTERNGSEMKSFNESSNDRLQSLRQEVDKKTRELQRSTHSQISAANEKNNELIQKNKRLSETIVNKDKVNNGELEAMKQSHLRKIKLLNDDFATELKDRSNVTSEALAKKDYQLHDKLNKLNSKFQDGQAGLISKYRVEIADLKKNFIDKSVEERRTSNKMLYNQKKDFGNAIKMVTSQNEKQTRQMQESYAQERRHLMNQAKDDVYRKTMEVRQELGKRFGSQNKQLEQKLSIKEKENYKTEMKYMSKLEALKNKFMDEINRQQEMEVSRRETERRDMKKMIENLNEDHYRQLINAKNIFDKEMLRSKNINSIKQEELTASYERKLRQDHNDAERKLKTKLGEARDRFDRMKADYETRLQALKGQYEMRIEKLQQSNIMARSAESLSNRSLEA